MKNKKAEISVSMIIGIIIVVVTFVIIALVYSQLTASIDLDRETCKTSAMLRGTMPSGVAGSALEAQELISLKCKTKKICVTTNLIAKGDCPEFGTTEGKYSTYRISTDLVKADQQIKTLLAREMADCWDMLGKGTFSIFGRELTTKSTLGAVAVICSRIQFDKTIIGEEKGQLGISEIKGFNHYLLTHKVPNHEISYWDFLRNAYDGETIQLLSGDMVKSSPEFSSFLENTLDITSKKTIIFMEVRPTLAGALIGGTVGAGIGLIGTIYSGGSGAGALIGGGVIGGGMLGNWIQMEFLRSEGLFPGADNNGLFASGIFLTDYDLEGFQKIMPKISKDASFEIASYA